MEDTQEVTCTVSMTVDLKTLLGLPVNEDKDTEDGD